MLQNTKLDLHNKHDMLRYNFHSRKRSNEEQMNESAHFGTKMVQASSFFWLKIRFWQSEGRQTCTLANFFCSTSSVCNSGTTSIVLQPTHFLLMLRSE